MPLTAVQPMPGLRKSLSRWQGNSKMVSKPIKRESFAQKSKNFFLIGVVQTKKQLLELNNEK